MNSAISTPAGISQASTILINQEGKTQPMPNDSTLAMSPAESVKVPSRDRPYRIEVGLAGVPCGSQPVQGPISWGLPGSSSFCPESLETNLEMSARASTAGPATLHKNAPAAWYSPAERPRNLLQDFDAAGAPTSTAVWDPAVILQIFREAHPMASKNREGTNSNLFLLPDEEEMKRVLHMCSTMAAQLAGTLKAIRCEGRTSHFPTPDDVDIWLEDMPLVTTAGILNSFFFVLDDSSHMQSAWSPLLGEPSRFNELRNVVGKLFHELAKDSNLDSELQQRAIEAKSKLSTNMTTELAELLHIFYIHPPMHAICHENPFVLSSGVLDRTHGDVGRLIFLTDRFLCAFKLSLTPGTGQCVNFDPGLPAKSLLEVIARAIFAELDFRGNGVLRNDDITKLFGLLLSRPLICSIALDLAESTSNEAKWTMLADECGPSLRHVLLPHCRAAVLDISRLAPTILREKWPFSKTCCRNDFCEHFPLVLKQGLLEPLCARVLHSASHARGFSMDESTKHQSQLDGESVSFRACSCATNLDSLDTCCEEEGSMQPRTNSRLVGNPRSINNMHLDERGSRMTEDIHRSAHRTIPEEQYRSCDGNKCCLM